MPRNRWLTPDSAPTEFVCRRVFIPNGIDWIAIVSGALNELIYDYNFEEYGTSTPEETAAVFMDMFDKFSVAGGCHMIGEVITWAGTSAPGVGMLECNGQAVLIADYPELYALIGNTYNTGVGSPYFCVPNLVGANVIGTDHSGIPIGTSGGAPTHTITVAEMPSHTHSDVGHTHAEGNATPAVGAAITGVPVPSAVPSIGVTGTGFASLSNTGGGNPIFMYSPFIVMSYYIQAK